MNPENISYAAKVNAAYHLIRNARKIARRLTDATPEQRQAIESEIVEIGMRLYSETREEKQPEVARDPEQDHELEAYVTAVRELVPDAERLIFERYQDPRLSPAELAERWQAFRKELEECRKQ